MSDPLEGTQSQTPPRTGSDADDITKNKPLLTAIVMLIGAVSGVPVLIAAIMAYVFKGEVVAGSWEETHYRYHIRTFWGAVIGTIAAFILMIVLIGFLLFPVLAVWVIVRSVIPLIKANERQPMPNPETWLF
ncbi:MAG: DUF4870 domain-containing protein [Pacificimonas sp.]